MCFIFSTTSLDGLDIDWLGNKTENHDEENIDQHHKITIKNKKKTYIWDTKAQQEVRGAVHKAGHWLFPVEEEGRIQLLARRQQINE